MYCALSAIAFAMNKNRKKIMFLIHNSCAFTDVKSKRFKNSQILREF
jgi:hypothetical protein